MKLLVTNDDGIDAVFLHELVRAIRAAGHTVWVVAPKHEQSWISKAMSRTRPVHAERVECRAGSPDPANRKAAFGDAVPHGTIDFSCPTWVVDGTPSDCVNIALHHLLPEKPDGVVSGPNIGCNAGLPFILGSGTVAGAVEATFHGFPAVAISQDLTVEAFNALKAGGGPPPEAVLTTLRVTCRRAAEMIPDLLVSSSAGFSSSDAEAPEKPDRPSTMVHNLNFPFPCAPETEVKRTVPARVLIGSLFSPAQPDGAHRFHFGFGEEIPTDRLSDQACLARGCISHTVLDYGRLGVV